MNCQLVIQLAYLTTLMSKMNCDQPLDADVIETKNVILNCQGYKLEIPYDIAMKFPTVKAAIGKFDTSGGYYLNHNKEEVQQFVAKYEKSLEDDLGLELQELTEKDIEIADYMSVSDEQYHEGYLMWIRKNYNHTFVFVEDDQGDCYSLYIHKRDKTENYSSDIHIRTLQVMTHDIGWKLDDVMDDNDKIHNLSYSKKLSIFKRHIADELNKMVWKQMD